MSKYRTDFLTIILLCKRAISSSGLFILSSEDSVGFVVDIALGPADDPEHGF